jgi:hypothetical protein
MRTRAVVIGITVAGLAPPLAAQDFLDRGVFTITRAGGEVGREEFAIRASPGRGGQSGVLVVSTVSYQGREIQHSLELTADHTPVTFRQTETAGGRAVRHIAAQLAGLRYSARISSPEGEAAREFPVRPPAVILADDAFSTYYFVPRPTDGQARVVNVVRPGESRAFGATVEGGANDTVSIAGRTIEARRYSLRLENGDQRLFWLTPTGDLLRVALTATGTVATRAEPPQR